MSAAAQQVLNEAVKKVGDVPKISEIFTASYKRGPIRRDKIFKAINLEDAERIFTKFVTYLNSKSLSKVMKVGAVKPFALDLEDEIMKEVNE